MRRGEFLRRQRDALLAIAEAGPRPTEQPTTIAINVDNRDGQYANASIAAYVAEHVRSVNDEPTGIADAVVCPTCWPRYATDCHCTRRTP